MISITERMRILVSGNRNERELSSTFKSGNTSFKSFVNTSYLRGNRGFQVIEGNSKCPCLKARYI